MLAAFPAIRAKTSAIALDLGRATFRALQTRMQRGRVERVDAIALNVLRPTEEDSESPEVRIERAARMLGQAGFVGHDVSLALGTPDVSYVSLRMPERLLKESDEQLGEAVAWEVIRETRTEPGELEIRHWRLTHSKSANVLAVAAPSKPISQRIEQLDRLGFTLCRIEPAPCALIRAARRVYDPPPQSAWGILDLGRRQTTLTVVIGTTPHYVRDLRNSADGLTQRLANAFDLSFDEAERLKRVHGVAAPTGNTDVVIPDAARDLASKDLPAVIFGVLRPELDELVRQIVACFSYALNGLPELEVARLVLTGGGANLPGLADWLELQCGLTVNRLTADDPDAAILGADATVAYGASLGDLE